MDLLKRFLNAIVGSKKAVAAIATAIFVLVTPQLKRLGVEVTEDELERIVMIALTYLAAQGVADMNKEAAKIHTGSRQNGGTSGGISPGAPPAEPEDDTDEPVEPKAA